MQYNYNPEFLPVSMSGIYSNMPIDVYHSDCCIGPSISSTGIRQILEDPAGYWADSYLNPDREEPEEKEDKPHYSLGSAAHTLALGDTEFWDTFCVKPKTYIDPETGIEKKWHSGHKYCKAWADEQGGKTLLSDKQWHTLQGIAGVLPWQKACPGSGLQQSGLVQAGILSGSVERSLIVEDPETGIWLKARPDNNKYDMQNPVDLKTCDSVKKVHSKIADFGYNIQAGVVAECTYLLTGSVPEDFTFLFVETQKPFSVAAVRLTSNDLHEARLIVRHALRKMRACLDSRKWPSLGSDDIVNWYRPDWYERRIERMKDFGELKP